MNMNNRDIISIDVETTGLNPKDDFIIQLSLIKLRRKDMKEIDRRNWYILPMKSFMISPDAEKVHGISRDFLEKNGVSIKSILEDFKSLVRGCDFLSYNGNNFDMKMLYKDFGMIGYDVFEEDRKYYDAYSIEAMLHPRNLSAVYKNYVGKEMENAHNSMCDVEATCEVFKHQLSQAGVTFDALDNMDICKLISPEGSIRNASSTNNESLIVFSHGKYKDSDVADICVKDPSYIKWFVENVASERTKKIIREYYYKKYPKKGQK